MLGWTNTNGTGANQTVAPGGATINGTQGYRGLWIATGQDLSEQSGANATVAEQAARTATTCYMRGLSEHIRIQTSSNQPWFWRRIVFTVKGPALRTYSTLDTPVDPRQRIVDTTSGTQRLLFNELINTTPNTINNHDAIIFKGAKGLDWTDVMLAPVDTRRVTLMYDKTRTFQTGNERGILKEFKLWHPFNKNLVYGDDESGDGEIGSAYSVESKPGMGDVYVMDLVGSGLGAASGDLMNFFTSSTLYWHEK